MQLWHYRLALDPLSPFGTAPTSGTLFGHLAWAMRYQAGRPALREWLARLPAEPFMMSDLLPADHLPKPLLAPVPEAGPARRPDPNARPGERRPASAVGDAGLVAETDRTKALKRRRYVSVNAWKQLRTGASMAALHRLLTGSADRGVGADPPFLREARTPHNRIDRLTGQTPAAGGGGLWFADELWPDRPDRSTTIEADLYVRTVLPADRVKDLLAQVGETGYGRDAGTGRGRFHVVGHERADWLDEVPRAGGGLRQLSLSQGVVTPNMTDARWRRFVLFGKVGRTMMAEGVRPWKLPLVLAEPGCTFAPEGPGPYGAWVNGVHQDDPEIGHNAFHLAIPYTEATP